MEAFLKKQKSKPSSSKDVPSQPIVRKSVLKPWVEKYRPRTVDEVAYQDEVVAVLKKILTGADLPNLLFYGPPGTGKTSTILALAHEMFGDMYRDRILELNASDERGIQVIRDKVKSFSQRTASGVRPDGRPCPAFKIIILDEADAMTTSAQAALRRTMEKESKSTRFCLLCNYISRIIEPLTSRCSKFRFKPLHKDILISQLKKICASEDVKMSDKVMEELIKISEGDLRKAITLLQSAHRLKGQNDITLEDIGEIAGTVPTELLDGLYDACLTDSYEKLESYVMDIIYEGYSVIQLISQLHDYILFRKDLNGNQKSEIIEKLAISEHCLLEGADEFLQLMDVCTVVMQQLCHPS
ncbi:replication factor C subunit 4 isoform X1 [Centruroides vittatus]|uniref:replication factor C subunit 4 isoform X1 n=1 Tax=Centruroides vittatus TaxID=120091 RepID=UPI00350F6BE3